MTYNGIKVVLRLLEQKPMEIKNPVLDKLKADLQKKLKEMKVKS